MLTSAVFQLDLGQFDGAVQLFLNGQHDQVGRHTGERLGFVCDHPVFDRPVHAAFNAHAQQPIIAFSGHPADDPLLLEDAPQSCEPCRQSRWIGDAAGTWS